MKLLMIHNYFESHCGGLDLIAGRLVRELLRLGQDVRWLASNTTPPPTDRELGGRVVPVRVLNVTERRLGIPFPIPSPRTILRIAREVRRSDVVLLQDSLYPMCVAAFLFARWWRKPVIIAQHVGIVPYRNRVLRGIMGGLNRVVGRPMLAHAGGVAFFSELTARYFSSVRFRSPPRLMFTGVDTRIFGPVLPDQKPEIRRRLGLGGDRPVALFVGRFVEKKGLHILSRMARQRPDVVWAFAGWGHIDPREWGLPNVLVFSGLSGAELAPLYQASDVFVLPSKGEGFPLVIQEALACGLPVVCSSDTATADAAVSSFLSGVSLDEANLDATAAAFCRGMDRALTEKAGRRSAAAERFAFVAGRYSWPACAEQYLELIRSAASDSAAADPSPRIGDKGPEPTLGIGRP
jgi:glycosyltransferase involved in cell wall biosynthesis